MYLSSILDKLFSKTLSLYNDSIPVPIHSDITILFSHVKNSDIWINMRDNISIGLDNLKINGILSSFSCYLGRFKDRLGRIGISGFLGYDDILYIILDSHTVNLFIKPQIVQDRCLLDGNSIEEAYHKSMETYRRLLKKYDNDLRYAPYIFHNMLHKVYYIYKS